MTTSTAEAQWPVVGVKLGPETVAVDRSRVQRYVACVNDSTFAAHADEMTHHFGWPIAPATVLDGELGSLIFRKRYGILGNSLHAAQGFRFHRPLRVGAEYEMSAEVVDMYDRRGIPYVSVRGWCRDDDGLCLTQTYLKALEVPTASAGKSTKPMTVSEFTEKYGGSTTAVFPAVGAVVQGGERVVDMETSKLFSEVKDTDLPGRASLHTDTAIAEARGFGKPIMKGLLATVSEAQLYREVFGPDWYTRGYLSTKYVRGCPVGSNLEAVGVVTEAGDGHVSLKSAVAADGVIVTVGEAGIE
jgi:acyl dehydratase